MSRKFIFVFLAFVIPGLVFAYTPAETRANYARCMHWLGLSHGEKVAAVQRTGQNFEKVQWACQYQKKRGLKGMLADERAYQRGERGGGGGSASNACSSSRECGHDEHCLSGKCENTINSCSSNIWCGPGQSCTNGRCS